MHRIIAFVLAEGPIEHGRREEAAVPPQSGPSYVPTLIPRQIVLDQSGEITLKAYHPNVLMAEVTREVVDAFSDEAYALRERLIDDCRRLLLQRGASLAISEEYAIAVVDGYDGGGEQFLSHDKAIVRFLKSEPLALHQKEIAHSLANQITYGENDLLVVDWDGAFVFQQNGKVGGVVDLLQLANLHLLQYRMIDADLDKRLQHIDTLIRTKAVSHVVFWNRELSHAYKEVISMQATSVIEFDSIIREIKLIGDWYAARVYEIAARKFRLEGWRDSIKTKLSTLENAYDIISQNFRISKENFFELMLQIGWLVLILLELYDIMHG